MTDQERDRAIQEAEDKSLGCMIIIMALIVTFFAGIAIGRWVIR